MSRWSTRIVITLAALAPFVLACGSDEAVPRRPNIVFLLIDDLGWSDLPAYGNQFHHTPVIDRLAEEGVRFSDFYATSPVCSATRSTIQTGQYPARTGITNFIPGHRRPFEKLIAPRSDDHLKDDVDTIGDVLSAAGYRTAYFGKWHLGSARGQLPKRHGYEVTEGRLPRAFHKWRGKRPPGPKGMNFLTDAALWFIERSSEAPFFVMLSHRAVHIPLEANEATFARYEKKAKPEVGVNNPFYAAMIEDLDRSIGRILAKLHALDLDRNTIVILASENGALHRKYNGEGEAVSSNAPLRGEKGSLYEGGVRVPLIVRWPGVAQAGEVSTVVTTAADLFPSICEMASAELPAQVLDGVSLVELLKEPAARLDRESIYFHYPHYHHSRPAGAIRSGNWKLIEFFDDASIELYDLASDIGERTNLSIARPEIALQMQSRLVKWRDRIGARMPRRNPAYDPKRAFEWETP